ncbi:MAG: spermidine/putrescine ABC transporter permease PotC, partial [Proteobacteria bacterium]|nr:spermidine/putrescine ABC transporter permease PotC [Pseudomonadota bacterium]
MVGRDFDVRRLPGFGAVAVLTVILLYLPIVILVVFSFNAEQSQTEWGGFSLRWYEAAFANQKVVDVSIRSLWLAL